MQNENVKIKVLIVDDEPDLLEICCDSFELEGHDVTTSLSGQGALELLAQNSYDVIISDSKMPQMSGEEFLLKAVDLLGDRMPLFYMASGAVELDVDSLNSMGMTGLIAKPFDIDDLVNIVVEQCSSKKALAASS